MKRFRLLVGIIAIFVLLGANLAVPFATAVTVKITVDTTSGNGSNDVNLILHFPATVGFAASTAPPGTTFLWNFGDGSTSSDSSPTHSYTEPCVYSVVVKLTAVSGAVTTGRVVLAALDEKGQPGGGIGVCPSQGTSGLLSVQLGGGYFPPFQDVNITMDGANVATVTADRGGDWILNITGLLTPRPNGSLYAFSTTPTSLTRTFTTLEGIRATPSSGAPGDTVHIFGLSYPADSTVLISLGGVSLGTAQTDGSGSFQADFQVPAVNPLTQAGTYAYTTEPPILGSQARFTSAGGGGGGVVQVPEVGFPWWWLLLLAIPIILLIIYARRRKKREPVPPPQGDVPPRESPSDSEP